MAEETVEERANAVLADLGELLAGLMVPYSIGLEARHSFLGAGEAPLKRLYDRFDTLGYPDADTWNRRLQKVLYEGWTADEERL